MLTLDASEPLARAITDAIQTGDLDELENLLATSPELATARIVRRDRCGEQSRSLLHIATDYPGHFPNTEDTVRVLIAAGADVNAEGSVIDGGTPLADAVGFGQWNAARRLVERGATPNLWQAAALGQIRRVEQLVAAPVGPTAEEITNAFWCACHGGQRQTAEYLLDRGADINWIGHDNLTPSEAAARSDAHDVVGWLQARGARSGAEPR